jgi:hypothetical protein
MRVIAAASSVRWSTMHLIFSGLSFVQHGSVRWPRRRKACALQHSVSMEWVYRGQSVAALTKMPHNIRMHLTGYSGLRPLPPAGDAER